MFKWLFKKKGCAKHMNNKLEVSTIDGQRLSSEDAIAEYIASMLLLETDPVFYISYDGVYTTGGTDYYEFRCHR